MRQDSSKKKKYQKPKITSQEVHMSFFYSADPRNMDSIDSLLGINLVQGSPGCAGCGSKQRETPA